ncbi:MAG: hypothetical protein KDJ54_08420 [Candidatus Competibacteraceae bacterium]|nr:hypothetical protein [Candidatus Competibacteraceae bacterium]
MGDLVKMGDMGATALSTLVNSSINYTMAYPKNFLSPGLVACLEACFSKPERLEPGPVSRMHEQR